MPGEAMVCGTRRIILRLTFVMIGACVPSIATGQSRLGDELYQAWRDCGQTAPLPRWCEDVLNELWTYCRRVTPRPFVCDAIPQNLPRPVVSPPPPPNVPSERDDTYRRYCDQTPRPSGCEALQSGTNHR
jgi:hypothetical protein